MVPTISHETGISPQGALKALRSLSEAGFCRYDAPSEWIFVPSMARFQIGERLEPKDNRIKWIRRELETLVKAPFLQQFPESLPRRLSPQRRKPLRSPFRGPSKPRDRDRARSKEYPLARCSLEEMRFRSLVRGGVQGNLSRRGPNPREICAGRASEDEALARRVCGYHGAPRKVEID